MAEPRLEDLEQKNHKYWNISLQDGKIQKKQKIELRKKRKKQKIKQQENEKKETKSKAKQNKILSWIFSKLTSKLHKQL